MCLRAAYGLASLRIIYFRHISVIQFVWRRGLLDRADNIDLPCITQLRVDKQAGLHTLPYLSKSHYTVNMRVCYHQKG